MEKKCKPPVSKLKRRTGSITAITTQKLVGKQCGSQSHDFGRQGETQDGQTQELWTSERGLVSPVAGQPQGPENPVGPLAGRDGAGEAVEGAGSSRTLTKVSLWT